MNSVKRKLEIDHRIAFGCLSAILWVIVCLCECHGQGTITFDGPPAFLASVLVNQYEEAGLSFNALTNIQNYGGFNRIHSILSSDLPYNGTGFIQASSLSPVQITPTTGSLFGLFSVDLAEQQRTIPDAVTIVFTGYHADGSTITASFTTDGIIGDRMTPDFQTFYFGPEFSSDLTRVVISRPAWALWSLDNLVVSIPEPGLGTLLTLGGAMLALRGLGPKRYR